MATSRSILITGCSSGIGYAAAHTLSRRGWRVFTTCRKQEDCDRLAGEGLESVQLDYTDADSIGAAVDTVLVATGGTLDALFNNGSYAHPGAVEDVPREELRLSMEANFIGWWDLTNRILPVMRKQNAGRIVNCSSVLGFVSTPFTGAYNATKFAVEAWSDALRMELRGTGIRISIIEPGPIRTRFIATSRQRVIDRIDIEASAFGHIYRTALAQQADGQHRSPFALEPDAVVAALIHALESPNPRSRYRVTLPAQVTAWLKRLLPTRLMDWILLNAR